MRHRGAPEYTDAGHVATQRRRQKQRDTGAPTPSISQNQMMRSWFCILFIFALSTILADGFELEHMNQFTCNESKGRCLGEWKELNQSDLKLYNNYLQKLGGGKANRSRDIGLYPVQLCVGIPSRKPFLNVSGFLHLPCVRSPSQEISLNEAIAILKNGMRDKLQNLVSGMSSTNGSFDRLHNCLEFGNITKTKRQGQILESPPHYSAQKVNISFEGESWQVNKPITVLDSDSSMMTLPPLVYDKLVDRLKLSFNGKFEEVQPTPPFQLCFKFSGFDEDSLKEFVMDFNGIRIQIQLKNYVVDVKPDVKCLAIRRGEDAEIFVIGSKMKGSNVWEFELLDEILGFVTSGCVLLFFGLS